MTANDPVAVVWAAVLCACVLLWAALDGGGTRRRARRTIGGIAAGRKPAGGFDLEPGRRLREVAAGLRTWLRGRGLAGRLGRWARPEALCVPAGAVVAAATSSVLPLLAGVAAVPLAGRALRRRSELAAAERGAAAVGALCGALAGDLRAGRPPHAALGDAIEAAGWPGVPELSGAARLLLSAARFGGDVPQALRAAARLSEGTRGLAAVAACWQVALDGGAGLAAALDRVAAALRAEADQRDDLRAQLAGPRSTAGLLALLPLFGVVLGAGLGARPAHILLHTATGLACLLAGALLEWAGLAWTSRIIRTAESGRPAPRPPAPRGPNDPDRTGGPGGSGGPAGGEGGPGRSGGPGGRDRPDMSGRSEGPGARDTAGGFGPLSRPNGSGGSVGLGRPASSDPLGLRGEADRAGRGGGVSRVGRVGGGGRGERDRVSWGEADRAGRGGGGASRVGHVGLGGRGQGDRGSWGEADGGGRVRRGGWSEAHPVGCGGRPGRDAWRQVGRVGGGDPVGAVVAVGGGWSVHSLGTVVAALAVAGGAVAVAVDGGRQRKGVGRLRVALGGSRSRRAVPERWRRGVSGFVRRWGPPAAAGLAAGGLVGGALGVLVGLLAAVGVVRALRGRRGAADGRTAALEPDPAQLPLCADLMAACLAAGASPGEAAGAVGGCLGGTLGAALIRAQAELRLGGDPVECWQRFGAVPAAREMGRCLARASTTGVAPVAEMTRLAADLRAAHGRTALAGARKAAVLATAPLGLCFLPAFLLVGVVPVVIGLAGTVLGAGGS